MLHVLGGEIKKKFKSPKKESKATEYILFPKFMAAYHRLLPTCGSDHNEA